MSTKKERKRDNNNPEYKNVGQIRRESFHNFIFGDIFESKLVWTQDPWPKNKAADKNQNAKSYVDYLFLSFWSVEKK